MIVESEKNSISNELHRLVNYYKKHKEKEKKIKEFEESEESESEESEEELDEETKNIWKNSMHNII